MLKREIKYQDFNGEDQAEVFYFNLSKSELIEMQVEYDQGFDKMIEAIIEEKNNKELVKKFKELILLAYGKKSEDGKQFIKTDALREAFSQTAAYQELFMELASNDGAAAKFLTGVLPRDLVDQDKPASLPGLSRTEG